MKKLLYPLLALMFISTTANASGQQSIWKCASAIKADDLNLARTHAADVIILSPIFGEAILNKAAECLDYAFGSGWEYDKTLNALVNGNKEVNAITSKILNEDQNARYYQLVSDLVYLTENARKQLKEADERRMKLAKAEVKAEVERLELEELKLRLTATIAKLEKRASCVRAKSSQTNAELDAISMLFEQTNKSLILDDTHRACTELYSSDTSAAMLNQTCVEAFQRMGHPNLVFSETEQKSIFKAELSGLVALETSLEEELMEARVKLLEAEGVVTKEDFNQQLADDLEAKSCAEFGYEGVYLD